MPEKPHAKNGDRRVSVPNHIFIPVVFVAFPEVQAQIIEISDRTALLRADFSRTPEAMKMQLFWAKITDPLGSEMPAFKATTLHLKPYDQNSGRMLYDMELQFDTRFPMQGRLIRYLTAYLQK